MVNSSNNKRLTTHEKNNLRMILCSLKNMTNADSVDCRSWPFYGIHNRHYGGGFNSDRIIIKRWKYI